jgi:2-polyprenyl-6-methoxyphenol hydroxylase-like FAD-dependent oxidoreductase
MTNSSVLISGSGIGGPTLAYWLKQFGFSPTLVERSPALRTGGYVIDFWGLGYDIAERMGLLSEIHRIGYHTRELRVVNHRGQRVAGFGTNVFRELTDGRFVTLPRSELSRLLFELTAGSIEVMFGDEIVGLEEEADSVRVKFKHAAERSFSLVIGADGLHSGVRRLVFGPQDRFEKRLGYSLAAFEVSGYRPRDEDVYVTYCQPGRQVARFALREDRTLLFFIFIDAGDPTSDLNDIAAQKTLLRDRFADMGWECAAILSELDRTSDLYFDRVSQIRMDTWWKGRVALIGDAAFCVSLMAGQGAALAMTAAYVLAGELAHAHGGHEEAFRRYETLLRPFLAVKQRGAERFASSFVPRTHLGLFIRNVVLKAFRIPNLARIAVGRELMDHLRLPDYLSQRSMNPERE